MRKNLRSGLVALFIAAVGMGACANDPANLNNGRDDAIASGPIDGEAAYRKYCAGCHETGMMGAPVAGDSGDWDDRSQLWDAVLLDHAITGYLEMPARGGRMDLPDEIVRAAAEYMLETTFPDRLHDCNPPACTENGT
jgi:cytochrome c5